MKTRRFLRPVLSLIVVAATALRAEEPDTLVGAKSAPGGGAFLIKEFSVPPGLTVTGISFHNNDKTTTFPQILVLEGPAETLSEAEELVRLKDVRPGEGNVVTVSTPPLHNAADWTTLLVAIELPALSVADAPGTGAGIAAKQLDGVATSYFASGLDGHFGRMDVDYALDLVFSGTGKPTKAVPTIAAVRTHPNPFNPQVVLEMAVPRKGRVRVNIYDVAGRRVRTLVDREYAAGTYKETWDGRDSSGRTAAAGIYLANVVILEKEFPVKLVLTK